MPDRWLLPLDRLHARIVRVPLLHLLTAGTRGLLAVGFIPSGLTKALGERFTSLPPDNPVGHFFDALYQAGWYYQFIGWGQLLAAVCLLIPATTTLGALLYLPIILNIYVVTLSVGFQGTTSITGLMLLANLYLLCWDYDRLRALLPGGASARATPMPFGLPAPAGAVTLATAIFTGGVVVLLARRNTLLAAGLMVTACAIVFFGRSRADRIIAER